MRQEKEILALNAFDPRSLDGPGSPRNVAVERRLRSFGTGSVLFYREPIEMVRAEGVWMEDAAGKRYLDVYNNVPSVGHCHPHVVEAVSRQIGRLNVHTRYLNDVVDTYAERLLATLPDAIDNLVLTCTGSEANDLALRVAQAATGGTGFIVTETAYHGNTVAVTDVSPSSRPGRPLAPHVIAVPAPDVYRAEDDGAGARFARAVEEAIAVLGERDLRVAGLIVDSIFSSDGVHADPAGFLKEAVTVVHGHGGLFVADEVQPGFGRTGDALWGFERHAVAPDIVTMGKPMGNGFPMGGMALRHDLLQAFNAADKYFNTFGGNPVAAAAGAAVLDVIRDEGLLANARNVGDYFRQSLREIANRHEAIGDVRGAGLFIGLEFVGDRVAKTPAPDIASGVINGLRERGVLIGAAGAYGNVLKIRPPLCFTREHVDRVVEATDKVLGERPV